MEMKTRFGKLLSDRWVLLEIGVLKTLYYCFDLLSFKNAK